MIGRIMPEHNVRIRALYKILRVSEENHLQFASMSYRENRSMANKKKAAGTFGSPLAICINDCEIDYGQPAAELQKVCFRLRCAFAEMRWGNGACRLPEPAAYTVEKLHQIEPR